MTENRSAYINQWLFRANEDISVIDSLVSQNIEHYTSSICFHAQQAVEKFLKAFLIYQDHDFPRTHDLDFLLAECQKINNTFSDIDLKSLSDFGVSIRYPDDFFIPDLDETNDYIAIAKKVKETVEDLINL